MARISFPLGFKIVDNSGASNTGVAIDERFKFDSITDRTNYIDNFFYEGLLTYTVGEEYHASGITSDAGYYFRNSSNTWQGLNADTVDDKHAYGTMDSSSNATTDPITSTNIASHINYLYTVTSALSGSRNWLPAVTNYSDIATAYPTPSTGDSTLVVSENSIYTYNDVAWVKTGSSIPMLSATVDGIVSRNWYNSLYDVVTNPANYYNQRALSNLSITNNGALVSGSPVVSTAQQDTFTINCTGGLSATISGKTITLDSSGAGTTLTGASTLIPFFVDTDVIGNSLYLRYDYTRLYLSSYSVVGDIDYRSVFIGANSGRQPSYYSVGIGTSALSLASGNYNTAIGYWAGGSNTGSRNVLIGPRAGFGLSTNDKLYITNYDGSSTRILISGDFVSGYVNINGSLQIGSTDTSISRISGDMTFVDANIGPVTLTQLYNASTISAGNGLSLNGTIIELGGQMASDDGQTTIDTALETLVFESTQSTSNYKFLLDGLSGLNMIWENYSGSSNNIKTFIGFNSDYILPYTTSTYSSCLALYNVDYSTLNGTNLRLFKQGITELTSQLYLNQQLQYSNGDLLHLNANTVTNGLLIKSTVNSADIYNVDKLGNSYYKLGQYTYFRSNLSTDTNNDVRIYCNSTGYYIERREAGSWVIKLELLF